MGPPSSLTVEFIASPPVVRVIYATENCACFDLDITHIESLCNLEALLSKGQFTFICLPVKWRDDGMASPICAVAVFDT
jgi:hypothetical protein